jgi:hypothetical protein
MIPLKWKVKARTMTGTAVKSSNGEERREKSGSIRGIFAVPLKMVYTVIPIVMSMNRAAKRMDTADVYLSESANCTKIVNTRSHLIGAKAFQIVNLKHSIFVELGTLKW